MYVKHPINAEYKPYCGSRPATTPYAIACGIVVRPTVKPAIKSCNRKLASYLGSHEIIGNFRVIVERPQPFWRPSFILPPILGKFSLYSRLSSVERNEKEKNNSLTNNNTYNK